ncbi:hypothetical protein LZ30DRAFT_385504 [Colletotrichum cereale]|nr:hypothetical protein LZ30DRAFT_385504 [Colletotrichum cereale]
MLDRCNSRLGVPDSSNTKATGLCRLMRSYGAPSLACQCQRRASCERYGSALVASQPDSDYSMLSRRNGSRRCSIKSVCGGSPNDRRDVADASRTPRKAKQHKAYSRSTAPFNAEVDELLATADLLRVFRLGQSTRTLGGTDEPSITSPPCNRLACRPLAPMSFREALGVVLTEYLRVA